MKSVSTRSIAGMLAVIVIAGSMLAGCDYKSTGDKNMKFANIEQIMIDSGLAAQEKTHLEQVHQSLQDGAKLVEENYKTLPQDKVPQARQADANVLNAQWQAQQMAARNAVVAEVKTVTEQYREEHKIDAIMPVQSAMSYSKDLDVTADLVAKLKDVKIKFGEVPTISHKEAAPATAQPAKEPAESVK
ncbi:hypothetical protein AB6873_16090 [Rahnella rivi]|uniref:hypothetical protein n=2 Tax=Yersiniaceae TaxID=1903411 RepID=UPI000ABE7B1D